MTSDDLTVYDQFLSSCPSCMGVIDVTLLEPYSKIVCPHCDEAVRVRLTFDQFVISRQLGEGGMSRVFDAIDGTLERHVALKILNRKYSKDEVRIASFEREAQLTAAVTHPNVVKLFSVGKDQGNFYLAMELVSGGSLEQRINDQTRLGEKEALMVGVAIAEGLRAAYREGLIHRDVKPANILFADDGTPKIVDFGLALFHARDVDDSGEIWATPFYVAPEKVIEDREDFRSDMYSLGATLYHALTGQPPHLANTNSIQELKVIKSQPVRLEDSGFSFSPRTCEAVNRLLALTPEDRFQSYEEVCEAFRDAHGLLEYVEYGKQSRRTQFKYALIGLVIISVLLIFLFKPSPSLEETSVGNEVEHVHATSDTAAETLEAGTISVSDLFIEARSVLLSGDFVKARDLFDRLIATNRAKQPTLNWARFNGAISAIVTGDRVAAIRYFEDIQRDANAGTTENSQLSTFFKEIGAALSNDLAVEQGVRESRYDSSGEAVMGYLAHGLAQWYYGTPEMAGEFLMVFQLSENAKSLEWIEAYKKLLDPYLHDLQQASAMKSIQTENYSSLAAAEADREALEKILKTLKTEGQLKKRCETELVKVRGHVQRISLENDHEERQRLAILREREIAQFVEMSQNLPQLARGYDVTPVLELLRTVRFDVPEVRTALNNKVYLWQRTQDFLNTLMKDIAAHGYDGNLVRRNGVIFYGKVSLMDLQNLTLNQERGSYQLPLSDFSDHTWMNLAQHYLRLINDSKDYYDRCEMMIAFAKIRGLHSAANVMAEQLMLENRSFRQRWASVEQTEP